MDAPRTTRPGGRTARTGAAVLAAAIEELSARDYADISVESIAARAGVHKTTVYRRWGSKVEIIKRDSGPPTGAGAKTQVQELVQGRKLGHPRYRVVQQSGPEHARDCAYGEPSCLP